MHAPDRLLFLASLGAASFLFATGSARGESYEWGFTSGNLTPDLGPGIMLTAGATGSITSFATSNGTTVPHIGGVPATYMSVPVMPDSSYGYTVEFTASGGNGGSSAYINQYTFAYDLYAPNPAGWMALLNTSPTNANDADFYVASDGAVGIAGLGYSPVSTFSFNAWHRLVITADLAAGDVRYFLDGVKIFDRDGSSLLDGRFALYSNFDLGADVVLFNENYPDTTNYTHAAFLSAFAFADRTYSDAEVIALGGPNSAGILVPEPAAAVLGCASAALLALRRRRVRTP